MSNVYISNSSVFGRYTHVTTYALQQSKELEISKMTIILFKKHCITIMEHNVDIVRQESFFFKKKNLFEFFLSKMLSFLKSKLANWSMFYSFRNGYEHVQFIASK